MGCYFGSMYIWCVRSASLNRDPCHDPWTKVGGEGGGGCSKDTMRGRMTLQTPLQHSSHSSPGWISITLKDKARSSGIFMMAHVGAVPNLGTLCESTPRRPSVQHDNDPRSPSKC